jgi:hypothetical protein
MIQISDENPMKNGGLAFTISIVENERVQLELRGVKYINGKLYGPSYRLPSGQYFTVATFGGDFGRMIIGILEGKEKDSALQHQ